MEAAEAAAAWAAVAVMGVVVAWVEAAEAATVWVAAEVGEAAAADFAAKSSGP